ncbi:zinc finger protein 346-like [Patiria miniata]|uniref:C2H2-type domain-containing protein n=1 Tax=Patiria miniata TaxID=46514 RepID=A0A913ZSE8_PATMI|nr:zinc finger protein 346-like [Patiria miniata]
METSELSDISLPGLTLLETKTDARSVAMPSLPDFTLPEPSIVPEVRDNGGAEDLPKTAQSGNTDTGKLEGPEKQAQTLGEYKICSLCNVYLNSKVQADMHYSGKLHQKKLRQKALTESLASTASDMMMPVSQPGQPENTVASPPAEEKPHTYLPHCSVCGLTFTGAEQVQMHLTGARHAKKLRQLAQKQKLEEVKEEPANTSSVSAGFYCKYCDVVCTAQSQLDQHFQGSKHKNVMDAAKQATSNRLGAQPASSEAATPASAVYACPTCNVTANSEQQYLQHCSSAKHNNKLLNRPGKDKYRDHPYPNRRGAQGMANNPKNNTATKPAWGGGKWKSSSDSFNQRSTFNQRGTFNNNSVRPGRGRGRGTGRGRGRGWGMQSDNRPNTSFGNAHTSQTSYSAMQGSFGGGYDRSTMDKIWGASNASLGGGTGRSWQGDSKASSQEQKQWGSSNMLVDPYGMPDLDSFVRESSSKDQTNF